jgi:preprotein translocase subunit SecG
VETFVYTLHFIVCIVLIGVVLLQRGKGADLGASLGGGGANTIFGSRGAGNFLTKLTTASAILFMGTSLTLAYLGYEASDIRLFDEDEPFEVPIEGAPALDDGDEGGLQEIEAPAGGLVEIPPPNPSPDSAAEAPPE